MDCRANGLGWREFNGNKIKWTIPNEGEDPITISEVSLNWPEANGQLRKMKLSGADIFNSGEYRDAPVTTVSRELEATGVEPSLLELELSEQIHRLKALGVTISIDDFGTGNAAIAYLKDIPADVIKIDRCYVSGPGCTTRDQAIGAGITALAKRLNAVVIGEGVETEAQLRRLRDWGCDQFQGFHFSAAVTPEAFEENLRMP